MKKTIMNIRTMAALLIASAAFTACSNEDGAVIGEQPAATQTPQVYTLTLQAANATGAQHRALALDGTKLVAKWAAGDELTVINVTSMTPLGGTLTASNVSADGKTCTFSGMLTGTIEVGNQLALHYHATSGTQDGTLESAAAYDQANAIVTVASVDEGNITILESEASFNTTTAMLKLTLKDGSANALNATSLKMTVDGVDIFTASPTAATYTANGDGVLYFAVPRQMEAADKIVGVKSGGYPTEELFNTWMTNLNTYDVTFTATVGSDTYTATKTGYKLAAGKYYATELTMAKAPTYTLLSAATTSDQGKVVCAAGHLHDAKTAVPAGCTAVGILGKVTETGHGLILALKDATAQTWNTINGWTSVNTYAGTTLKVLPDDAARGANLTSYTALGTTAASNWAVAQKSDYEAIFTNLGSMKSDTYGTTYDDNVNAYITTGVGGTELSSGYFSATEHIEGWNAAWAFTSYYWQSKTKTVSSSVRPVLGFGGDAAPAYTMAASATASDKDKLICTDGHIHAYGADAACTKNRVAKIIYVGTTGDATYSHGLALALADEVSMMNWETAKTACSNKNTSTPVTDATWLLASKEQWDYMIGEDGADGYDNLRDGFNSVGGTNLEQVPPYYWSSTEDNDDSSLARIFRFDNGEWTFGNKGNDDDDVLTRACLAF